MTECTSTKLSFSSLKRQEIVANFASGRLTSDGEALLLREVDRRFTLSDAVEPPKAMVERVFIFKLSAVVLHNST